LVLGAFDHRLQAGSSAVQLAVPRFEPLAPLSSWGDGNGRVFQVEATCPQHDADVADGAFLKPQSAKTCVICGQILLLSHRYVRVTRWRLSRQLSP
jgi:hypothetical protein